MSFDLLGNFLKGETKSEEKGYFGKDLNQTFEVKIPDTYILNDNDVLGLEITFSNGKKFLVKSPNYMRYFEFKIRVQQLISVILGVGENLELLNLEELKQDNDFVNKVITELIDKYISILANKKVLKEIERLLKDFFYFRKWYHKKNDYVSYKEFRNGCSMPALIVILSVIVNIHEFIEEKKKLILNLVDIQQENSTP